MELAALLDAALHAPLVNTVVFVDPTYITKNLPNMSKLSPLRWTRFSNSHIWRQLLSAIDHRHSLGLTFTVLKCSAHGRDPTQHPHISLGNWVADLAAKEAAKYSSPLTDWLPDSQELFSLAYRGRLVRGDVRRHIRRTSATNSLTHQLTLNVEGMSTRLSYYSSIHNPTLAHVRNPLS